MRQLFLGDILLPLIYLRFSSERTLNILTLRILVGNCVCIFTNQGSNYWRLWNHRSIINLFCWRRDIRIWRSVITWSKTWWSPSSSMFWWPMSRFLLIGCKWEIFSRRWSKTGSLRPDLQLTQIIHFWFSSVIRSRFWVPFLTWKIFEKRVILDRDYLYFWQYFYSLVLFIQRFSIQKRNIVDVLSSVWWIFLAISLGKNVKRSMFSGRIHQSFNINHLSLRFVFLKARLGLNFKHLVWSLGLMA